MADHRSAAEEQRSNTSRRSEFTLAMSIFVTLSIIGTAFGLWMVGAYNAKPASAPPTVEGKAPVPQVPPVESAKPDAVQQGAEGVDKQ